MAPHRIMADAGCQCVYAVESAGALVLEGVADRVPALVAELGEERKLIGGQEAQLIDIALELNPEQDNGQIVVNYVG